MGIMLKNQDLSGQEQVKKATRRRSMRRPVLRKPSRLAPVSRVGEGRHRYVQCSLR